MIEKLLNLICVIPVLLIVSLAFYLSYLWMFIFWGPTSARRVIHKTLSTEVKTQLLNWK